MINNKIFEIQILYKLYQNVDYVSMYIQVQLINDHNFRHNFHISMKKKTISKKNKIIIFTGKISIKFTIRSPIC